MSATRRAADRDSWTGRQGLQVFESRVALVSGSLRARPLLPARR